MLIIVHISIDYLDHCCVDSWFRCLWKKDAKDYLGRK